MNSEPNKNQQSNSEPIATPNKSDPEQSNLGFFSELAHRRVPQAIGFYLAGSWTFLEFFESLISRYNISPHWQDVSLLVIVLLFPSLLIVAYRHGAPGDQAWTSFEKVGIPTNLLVALIIIVSQFSTKDLGSSSEKLLGMGPDGSMMERHRPKAEFRKRLSINYFKINDENADQYLALGIPLAIKTDLEQDPFLNPFDPTILNNDIKQANFRDLTVPMALMLKIAKDNRIEYLVTGSLFTKNERIILQSNVYNVEDGRLIKKLVTTDHADVFIAIDDISIQIKSAIGISGGHINHATDLPINEQLTSSMPAFIAYTKSQHDRAFKDDFVAEEKELQKAIKLDETFAAAASQYALVLLRQSRTVDGLDMLNKAKKHNYRLTDSDKFALGAIEALFSAQPDSARKIVKQWLELYPDDADAWTMKFSLHRSFDERLPAIEALRKVLEIEPFGTHRHLTIGEIYTSLGNIESALEEYEIFVSKNPTNARGHLLIGDSNRTLGQLDAANEQYQLANTLLTNDLRAERRLADLLLRTGEFNVAESQMKSHLTISKTPEDEFQTWQDIADFYWLRGQRKEALNALRQSFEALKIFRPETLYLLIRIQSSWQFAAAGEVAEGQQMIEDAKMLLNTNEGNIYRANINLSQALLNAQTGNSTQSLQLIEDVSISIANYVDTAIDDEIAMFRGIVFYLSKDYKKAAENMAVFLEKNPIDEIEMMFIMADSLYSSEQLDDAVDTLEEILEQFPSYPLANLAMAKIEQAQENPEEALEYIEKALKGWEYADEDYEPAKEARKIALTLKSI